MGPVIAYAICFYILALYAVYLAVTGRKDYVDTKLFDTKIFKRMFSEDCCSGWPLSHFLFNFLLGVLFPQCQLFIILMGICWEGFEWGAGALAARFLPKKKDIINTSTCTGDYCDRWVSGNFKDIVFNIAGLYTGVLIRFIIDRIIRRGKRLRDSG